jgi:formate--tetrahydrofolate ligase
MLGIPERYVHRYGDYKAKILLDILDTLKKKKSGKYIVVTGITPTPLGEGKTVTTIGLSMALNRIGRKSIACIREPSLGPLFGIKGGGTGGGCAEALPAEDINLHLTGDFHAVSAAHNLCAAFLDNHLFRGNRLKVDKNRIFWNRVVDINDRPLRNITIGLGGPESGVKRGAKFDITAASETMAILALSSSLADLKKRLSRIVVAISSDGRPVTGRDLKVSGAMAYILKDAIHPNLVQTSENTPCFVHTGPFANITHGNSSIAADRVALKLADFVVTESGFGADCGLEKFSDIKCRASGLIPDAAVLVCSVRALKMHSGRFKVVPGKALDKRLKREDLDAVREGCGNLAKQIENVKVFGIPCIVAINRFKADTDREIRLVKELAIRSGAFDCVESDVYSEVSAGGITLARAVVRACVRKKSFRFLYPASLPIRDKIERIAKVIYGAGRVKFDKAAEKYIALYEKLGYGRLPICMAKTHLSLSGDPHLKGRPEGFTLTVKSVKPSAGAGFLYALCGSIVTMPSLPSHPIGERIDIDTKGNLRYVP